MADINNKIAKPKNTNYVKTLIWISIPVFLLMISLLVFLWYNLNNNINDIREQNKKNYESIASLEKMSSIEIEYIPLNKKQVVIEPKELEKINNHIKNLTEAVQNEKNRTETLIDKDLSRLGTYMAVGIGFMTLLGVFVPILINVLSVQDLRDKQKDIDKEFEDLKKTGPNITKAISDSQKAIDNASTALEKSNKLDDFSKKISNIEEKTKKALPDLCNLILQNAIFRFFNVSSIVLTNAGRCQNYDEFIKILKAIQNGFERCKSDSDHTTIENNNFLDTIEDFILFLNTERFGSHPVFNGRTEYKEFEELIRFLLILRQSNIEDEETNYDSVINQIEVIIKFFKDKNVKDKPTA